MAVVGSLTAIIGFADFLMKKELLEILACPKCKASLFTIMPESGEIIEGELHCRTCNKRYPVTNGIPRFVKQDNYASSFGYQWNLFRREQIDSHNGTTLSANRFWAETAWTREEMADKWVLDAGCGAGRFLDVASSSDANIVGVDISNAVDAAAANLEGRENVHLVQASIYELPFKDETFDLCYCIGVIQHTPDPPESLRSIAAMVKPDGGIAVTIYPRKPYTKLFSKYWLRPITKRMSKERLLNLIKGLMPILFPMTSLLFRIPHLGKLFMFAIPVANYVQEKKLSREQRYSWAILDTFDMLSPYYDQPMTEKEALGALESAGCEVRRNQNPGLNLIGKKRKNGFGNLSTAGMESSNP